MVLAVLARAGDNSCRKFVIGLLANCKEQLVPKGGVFIRGYPNTRIKDQGGMKDSRSLGVGKLAASYRSTPGW